MLKKVKEITEFYDNIKESEEINDDMIFEWYKNYKMYQSEQLNLKCKNILNEIFPKKQGYLVQKEAIHKFRALH